MENPSQAVDTELLSFAPPYQKFENATAPIVADRPSRGRALVWQLRDGRRQSGEFEALRVRSASTPLVVLLPPASEIRETLPLIHGIPALRPRAVLPGPSLGTPRYVRHVLSSPPPSVAEAACGYLTTRGLLEDKHVEREVKRIFELAPEVSCISELARRMYTSRRTLGRHFARLDLPVASHWLQFARLFHVCIRLQAEQIAVFGAAVRAGYPDGFTMSNQMKRLIGVRPSEVRGLLGWEWVIEAWLEREGIPAE